MYVIETNVDVCFRHCSGSLKADKPHPRVSLLSTSCLQLTVFAKMGVGHVIVMTSLLALGAAQTYYGTGKEIRVSLVLARNSAVADKPRDAFVQYKTAWPTS